MAGQVDRVSSGGGHQPTLPKVIELILLGTALF